MRLDYAVEPDMDINKRSSERQMTMGLMSTVSDGKAAYLGVVEDISATGLCVSQVPAVFDDTVELCFTVVKGPSRDYKVLLHPRWARATNRGMYKVVGFQIDDPSEYWKDFVERISSESNPFHALASESDIEM
jgi:hypothetical protein